MPRAFVPDSFAAHARVTPTPLPPVDREAGIDLGIARFATVADTDRHRLDIANPKHLVRKLRTLARLERLTNIGASKRSTWRT